jgi:hypothetical protein
MKPSDAPSLPILTALNLLPLHRRQGVVVLRSAVKEALRDAGLSAVRLPKGRLIAAAEVEHLLHKSGVSAKVVRKTLSRGVWAKKTKPKKATSAPLPAPKGTAADLLGDIRTKTMDSDIDWGIQRWRLSASNYS